MKFWQFLRTERVEFIRNVVIIAVPAVVYFILTGSLTQPTIIATLVLMVVLLIFTMIKKKQREFEELQHLARRLNVIAGNSKHIIEGTSDLAIRKIALELLRNKDVADALGKGVAGWKAFFDKYGNAASEDFNRFIITLSGFVERSGDAAGFQYLMRDFKDSLLGHYTTLEYFYVVLKDIGIEKTPYDTEKRYKSFKQEYDSFVQNMRGIADELDSVSKISFKGTVLLYFTDQLEDRYGISFPARYA